jgi:hypothetical protein
MSRALLQQQQVYPDSDQDLTPEATAGFILAFVIVGFAIVVMTCYMVFLTGKIKMLDNKLWHLERHPKLQKTEADLD